MSRNLGASLAALGVIVGIVWVADRYLSPRLTTLCLKTLGNERGTRFVEWISKQIKDATNVAPVYKSRPMGIIIFFSVPTICVFAFVMLIREIVKLLS